MKSILGFALIFLLCCLVVFCLFILVRNYFVWKFRLEIVRTMIYNNRDSINYANSYEEIDEILDTSRKKQEIFDRVDYNTMLIEFRKPVKLESWYTEEEIQILKS